MRQEHQVIRFEWLFILKTVVKFLFDIHGVLFIFSKGYGLFCLNG